MRRSWQILAPFVWCHRARLLQGCAAAFAVVACRLLLPLPLRSWLDAFLAPARATDAQPLIAVAVIALALGLGNLLSRLSFARFAIAVVADLRAGAFAAVPRADEPPALGSGEAVARLIGDTARIKTAVKGFLVHVATNALFVVGLAVVLFRIWLPLGWILLAGAAVLTLLTTAGAGRMLRRAARYRGREGRLAEAIHQVWKDEPRRLGLLEHNRVSGEHEAALTRLQELVTWGAHAIFGGVLLGLVVLAGRGVASGRLGPADLMLIAFYALMLRTPIVQLARQGARTGKIFACVERVGALVAAPSNAALPASLLTLELRAAMVRGYRRRLGPVDLEVPAGQHVLVVGRAGAGKTAFLELLAGHARLAAGQMLWNGMDHPGAVVSSPRRGLVGVLAEDPMWPRQPVRQSLDLEDATELDDLPLAVAEMMQACGLGQLLRRLPKGLDTKLAAADLSLRERRALALVRAVLGGRALVLLDEPARDLGRRRGEALLRTIHDVTRDRTLVVAVRRPLCVELFDRLVELRRGRVVYDGEPRSWRPEKMADLLVLTEAS